MTNAEKRTSQVIIKSMEDDISQVLPVKAVAGSLGRVSSMPIHTIQKVLSVVKKSEVKRRL